MQNCEGFQIERMILTRINSVFKQLTHPTLRSLFLKTLFEPLIINGAERTPISLL